MQLNPRDFQFVQTTTTDPSSVDFSGATAYNLESEGVTLDISDNVIEQNIADSQEPNKVFKVGKNIEGTITPTSSNLEVINLILNGSKDDTDEQILVKSTVKPQELPLYAVQFTYDLLNNDNGNDEADNIITGVNIYGDNSLEYNNEGNYPSININSLKQSQMLVDYRSTS